MTVGGTEQRAAQVSSLAGSECELECGRSQSDNAQLLCSICSIVADLTQVLHILAQHWRIFIRKKIKMSVFELAVFLGTSLLRISKHAFHKNIGIFIKRKKGIRKQFC